MKSEDEKRITELYKEVEELKILIDKKRRERQELICGHEIPDEIWYNSGGFYVSYVPDHLKRKKEIK